MHGDLIVGHKSFGIGTQERCGPIYIDDLAPETQALLEAAVQIADHDGWLQHGVCVGCDSIARNLDESARTFASSVKVKP